MSEQPSLSSIALLIRTAYVLRLVTVQGPESRKGSKEKMQGKGVKQQTGPFGEGKHLLRALKHLQSRNT